MSAPTEERPETAPYQFVDVSLVRPALTRLWFARLFPLLPRWLAANLVTLASTGALLVVMVLALGGTRWSPALVAGVFLLALQIYVAGDHLDGMQAKASGTASPLGDFLDHFCDLWAGAILVYGFWSLLGAGRALLYAMVCLITVGFAVTFAEREERHRLHFARLGTLEAIVILTAFLASWMIPTLRGWWQSELWRGLPWYSIVVGTGIAMGVGTVLVVAARMRGLPMPAVLVALTLAAAAVMLAGRDDVRPVEGWFVLICYGAGYVARVMHGYLIRGHRSWPDVVATTAMVVLTAWSMVAEPGTATLRGALALVGCYLVGTLVLTLARIFGSLKRYWVWVNASTATT